MQKRNFINKISCLVTFVLISIIFQSAVNSQIVNKFGIKGGLILSGVSTSENIPNVLINYTTQNFQTSTLTPGHKPKSQTLAVTPCNIFLTLTSILTRF